MSVLQMTTVHQEDWIRKFDPNKRLLRGRAYQIAKRITDLFLVIITIPLWLPLNGIVALIIHFTSPGAPVVFKQLRTGKGGRRFYMYKFRKGKITEATIIGVIGLLFAVWLGGEIAESSWAATFTLSPNTVRSAPAEVSAPQSAF